VLNMRFPMVARTDAETLYMRLGQSYLVICLAVCAGWYPGMHCRVYALCRMGAVSIW